MADVLRVCALYPDLMNIYADRGNLQLLRKRCEWRGIGFELSGVSFEDELDPDAHDLFYMGGGQDRDQALCAEDLATHKRDALHAAAASDKVIFAVCGGYQLLGHAYELDGTKLPGVGLVDLETVREDGPRLIGNVAIEVDLGQGPRTPRGLREPRRSDEARRRHTARQGPQGPRQRRPLRLRGRPRAQRRRHLPARPAAAQERVVRGLADPDRDRRRARTPRRHLRGRRPRRRPPRGGAGRSVTARRSR